MGGHYESDYEYEDERNLRYSKEFRKRWNLNPEERTMSDNQSDNNRWAPWEDHKVNPPRYPKVVVEEVEDSYTVGDITEMRITVKKPGGSRLVLDVDGIPTYSFNLSSDETNSLLVQLLNHRHE